jgi:hypothetical protein
MAVRVFEAFPCFLHQFLEGFLSLPVLGGFYDRQVRLDSNLRKRFELTLVSVYFWNNTSMHDPPIVGPGDPLYIPSRQPRFVELT